jgi:hypothetical protein
MFKTKKKLIKRGKLWKSHVYVKIESEWYPTNISTQNMWHEHVENLIENHKSKRIYITSGELLASFISIEGNTFKCIYTRIGHWKTYEFKTPFITKRITFDIGYGIVLRGTPDIVKFCGVEL